MSKVKIQGHASGTGVITLTAPNTSTDRTVTLPDEDITLGGGVDGIVSTADATAITINSGENVGIGDTDPSEAKLSITGVQAGDVGVKIDHDIVDTHALQIAADNTSARGIDVECNALTTGEAAMFYSNSSDTSTRMVVGIRNDHVNATGTTALYVDNDSTGLAADFAGTGGIRSAGGIKFGTDTVAANTLDDYEEGTWTIAFQGATFTGGNRTGYYVKVGNLVYATVYCGGITISSVSGGGTCSGLPYNMASLSNHYAVGNYVHGNAVTGIQNFYLDYTNNKMYPVTADTTSTASWVAGSQKHLMISVTYRTA